MEGISNQETGKKPPGGTGPFFLFPVLFCLLGGCRNCDYVEAELRTRESELRKARAELHLAEAYNGALQRELGGLRQNSCSKVTPELASQVYTLEKITLGRQTGGYDDDDVPGDEALQVIVEPRDPDGHAIKAPGSLHVTALEISTEGLKTPFSSWDIGPDQVRRSWRTGLLSTGYQLVLPWKSCPTTTRVRVVAQFTLVDGRLFEADKDVTIRLAPASARKPPPAGPVIGPPPPNPVETDTPLPLPRKVEPGPGKSREGKGVDSGPIEPVALRTNGASLLPPVSLRE